MVIKQHHLRQAITTFENAFKDLTQMIDLACGTQESAETDLIEAYIKKHKKLPKFKLTKAMWFKKIPARRIEMYVNDLIARALVIEVKGKASGILYEWIGGK
jgi:hypothetical protein